MVCKLNLSNFISLWKDRQSNFLKILAAKEVWEFVNIGGYDPGSLPENHEFAIIYSYKWIRGKNFSFNLNSLLGVL